MRFGNFRFKLSNVPQIKTLFFNNEFSIDVVGELLKDVTWHLFIDDEEVCTCKTTTTYGGGVLYIYVFSLATVSSFYQLDESKSSVDLSSDMYIYLRNVPGHLKDTKVTSKTLFYYNGKRIWKPAFESPYMYFDKETGNMLQNTHSGNIQMQKLHTTQNRSHISGSAENFNVRKYRGKYGSSSIRSYGIYRYRLVKNGKKTQWRTISIMNNTMGEFSIK